GAQDATQQNPADSTECAGFWEQIMQIWSQPQRLWRVSGVVLAEAGGFEHPVRVETDPSLAVKSNRPLWHAFSSLSTKTCPNNPTYHSECKPIRQNGPDPAGIVSPDFVMHVTSR